MTFTSSLFLLGIFPLLLILAPLVRRRALPRTLLVLAVNVLFYLWGGAGFLLLFGVYIFVTWILIRLTGRFRHRALFASGCVLLSLPLVFVKYSAFAVQAVNQLLRLSIGVPSIAAPMGISFFTFTAISCYCDHYRGKVGKPVSLIELGMYLSFFPTVVSGPILRLSDFRRRSEELPAIDAFGRGFSRVILGLSKKLLLADKLAPLADYYFNGIAAGNACSVTGLWIGSVAYAMQLYLDFSGYTDIAVGIAGLLGYDLPENFNKPYHAVSVQDFWRRWHITLSRWFRDYIYIPLGGSRCSSAKYVRNLLCVWLLTGIWHGAGWTFILWGLGYFLLLVAEKYIKPLQKLSGHWYGHLYVLLCVDILWVFFRSSSLGAALRYLKGMIVPGAAGFLPETMAVEYLPFLLVILAGYAFSGPVIRRFGEKTWFRVLTVIGSSAALFLCVCAVLNASYTPYIYGNF